jgi:signal transduction histidine kinase
MLPQLLDLDRAALVRLLDHVDFGVLQLQPDGSVGLCNRAGRHVLDMVWLVALAQTRSALGAAGRLGPTDGGSVIELLDDLGRTLDASDMPGLRVLRDRQPERARVVEFRPRDGSLSVWVEASARPLFEHDRFVGALVSFIDISQRKRAEAAKRESQELFERIFNCIPEVASLLAPDGTFAAVNAEWERATDLPKSSVLGKRPTEVSLPMATIGAVLVAHSADDGSAEVGCPSPDDSGESVWELMSRSIDAGDVSYRLGLARDVTADRRQRAELAALATSLEARVQERTATLEAANRELEKALATVKRAQDELIQSEKLASLGSLVAGVAHELNTPIGNGVTVASTLDERLGTVEKELAAGQLRKSTIAEFLRSVKTASELLQRNLRRAQELIGSFKQVAVDQTSSSRRAFDLSEAVSEILMTIQPMFKKSPVELHHALDEVAMDSYPGSLGQVITNLVQNALVHAFTGRERGTVWVECHPAGTDYVTVEVRDDGVGIQAEHLPRIFDPFFTTKLGEGGSGLGLNIVYNIVTGILGGTIEASSKRGDGARFVVRIPRVAPRSSPSIGSMQAVTP